MNVNVSEDSVSECAHSMALELRRLIASRQRAVTIIGVRSDQGPLIDRLVSEPAIDWTRVICFHAREHIGSGENSPDSSRRFLNSELVARTPIAEFYGLRGDAANLNAVCTNYEALLKAKPPDVALIEASQLLEAPGTSSARVVVTGRSLAMTQNAILECHRVFVIAATEREVESLSHSPAGEHDGVHVFIS